MSGDYDNETVSPAYTQPDFTIKGLFVIIIIISIGYLWGVAMGVVVMNMTLSPLSDFHVCMSGFFYCLNKKRR
jgi:uncharacterized membrane protein